MKSLIISENNRTPEMRYPAIRIQKNRVFYLNAHLTRLLKKMFVEKKLYVKLHFLPNGHINFIYSNENDSSAYEFTLEAQRARICGSAFIKKIEHKVGKKICGTAYFKVELGGNYFSINLKEKLKIPALDDLNLNPI